MEKGRKASTNYFISQAKRNVTFRQKVKFDQSININYTISKQQNKENINQFNSNAFKVPFKSSKNLLNQLLKIPIISKTSIVLQMKCFTTSSQLHYSYLISKKLSKQARQKLRKVNSFRQYCFDQDMFQKLVQTVNSKPNDSTVVASQYQNCLEAYDYPVSVKLLLYYFGCFYYSLAGMYQKAQGICQKMYGQLIRTKAQQYIVIYLLMMIKLKTNLCQWQIASKMVLKLLAFAWFYKLSQLQIWCYFQLSRTYFFENKQEQSNFFQKKSQLNIFQPNQSMYKLIIIAELKQQLEVIKDQNFQLNFNNLIIPSRTVSPPIQVQNTIDLISQKKKMQSSIRSLNQACKVKYVKNLLPRISNNLLLKSKKYQEQLGISPDTKYSGNPSYMTHLSRIKNLNMYFRNRKNLFTNKINPLYTIENSPKNWIVLKQMLRNILIEMRALKQRKKNSIK